MTPEQFLKEYETSNGKHTLGMIAEDAVYWFSDGTQHVGKQEVEAHFGITLNPSKTRNIPSMT